MSKYLSKQDILKEIVNCGKNSVYFIDNYCKLSHPQRGVIPFKTWDYQQDLIQKFNDYQHNIILKSRQLGISWVSAAYAAWLMVFHREKSIMVIATSFKTAGNLVKKVKFMIKNLPPWFGEFVAIQFDNKTNFTLTNGSEIKAASTTSDVGRSESLSLLIIDEAAHIKNIEEVWTAAGPTMAAGGRSIALSSPNGVGNWFYNEYTKAEKGFNEFHPTKLMWDVHPERDLEWEQKERKKYSPREFDQEYNCSFLASGDTVINSDDLRRIFELVKHPVLRTGYDKNLYIWEQSISSNNYIVIGDVARGDGSDYSAIQVLKLENMNQVAEYKGKLSIEAFAKLLFDVGKEYKDAMLVVENNILGWEVCTKLISMGYPNLYYEEKGSHEYVPPYQAINAENIICGFTTSMKTRPLIIQKLEESIRRGFLTINSERTYRELETFIWNNGRPEAQKDHNDDLVMSLAIGCWIRETALKENHRSLQYKKTFLQTISRTTTKFDTSIPGMPNYNRKLSTIRPQIERQNKQFAWIYRG